ncbi:molybdopterin-dependent oxidoreductase [Streptomyces phytohabitans]|uniref:molybdopterin-dependent oxidoreductase n=1 Tax=Streptomyces phytohabitans TaxID=1150371 RepID=UPI00345B99C6
MGGVSETREATEPTAAPRRARWARRALRPALGAAAGLLSGACALGVAELASVLVRREANPVVAVGGAVIDRTPTPLKEFAVRNFGTNDKLVLQLGILALLVLFAVVLGCLALRHRRAGAAGVLIFGLVGGAAALSRPKAETFDPLPSVVGALAGAATLYLLSGLLAARGTAQAGAGRVTADTDEDEAEGPDKPAEEHPLGSPGAFDRRGFVVAAGGVAVVSAGAGAVGRTLNSRRGAEAVASRDAVRLPAPASKAAPVPRGADLGVRGVSPYFTPNADFYRVDTALVVPKVSADGWKLRIHGKGVTTPVEVTYDDLLERELVERVITMTCVSNEVGGKYAGNARWLGVPLAELLREAGVRPPSRGGPADQLVARSVDGMTLGSPVETVMDGRDAMLAVGMNGEPLPFEHGFPVRMLVPGLYGYVSACKWLEDLELTTFDDYDTYWVKRNWSEKAPIKTQSRIDTPKSFGQVKAGKVAVAGVAWAQHTGIDKVEVRVDDGAWQRARLADEDSRDTWRQWVWEWPATPGSHTLHVRATDRTGYTQTSERVGTVPDGATGRHSVVVSVE